MKFKVFAAALMLSAAAAVSPAGAADLGGDCCADLEERVAELEATTARKGNRRVSVTVYGKVNESIGYWDDGFEDNVYQFTNDTSRSRFGLKGKAKITKDWYAGYRIEIGVRGADQGDLSAANDDGDASELDLRHSYWQLGSKTYGSIRVGETSMAHDGITQIQTANIKHFANPDIIDAVDDFEIISARPGANGANIGPDWEDVMQVFEPGEGSRGNVVRYDTPALFGFKLSAHWGEDDIWGLAAKYANTFGGFKVAFGVGYGEATERDEECTDDSALNDAKCQEIGLSGSVMHKPTGLFATGAYGWRQDDGKRQALLAQGTPVNQIDDEDEFYHIQAGIEQKLFAVGRTTFFGGYHDRQAGSAVNERTGVSRAANDGVVGGNIIGSDIEMWELGVNQHFKAAAFDLYLHYKHYDADILTTGGRLSTEPWQTVIGGGHIKF